MYYLYIKHATRANPEKTQYKEPSILGISAFARGYIRGINDAARDGRYSGIVCDDQCKPMLYITKEGMIRNA